MRDDLPKLPLPPEAKSYARRKGLAAMQRQPQSFINMSAAVSNQRSKKRGFKNTDEVGTVPKAIKECARMIVAFLAEEEENQGYFEYQVYPEESSRAVVAAAQSDQVVYNIQVPHGSAIYVNKVWVPQPLDQKGIALIKQRMAKLASERKYPTGSFFVTPWGTYLIHGGTIGEI